MILKTADEIMGALERGDLAKDWVAAIARVIETCQALDGGKGSVSLKLTIHTKDDMVSIKAKLDEVTPKAERRTSSFFATSDGRLSLQHPDQIDMRFERQRGAVDIQPS